MAKVELTLLAIDDDQGDESSCADKIILSWHNKHGGISLLWVVSSILRFNKLQNHHWAG